MNKVEKQFSALSVFCVSKNKENQNSNPKEKSRIPVQVSIHFVVMKLNKC